MNKSEYLKKIAKLVGLDTADDKIEFIFDCVEEMVLNYCNLEELPDGLKNTVIKMCITEYEGNDSESGVSSSQTVKTITEGDTSVTFDTESEDKTTESYLLDEYKTQLNRYRRVVFN